MTKTVKAPLEILKEMVNTITRVHEILFEDGCIVGSIGFLMDNDEPLSDGARPGLSILFIKISDSILEELAFPVSN